MFTPGIFDFDTEDVELDRARQAMVDEPAAYINHLVIAKWLSLWAENHEDRTPTMTERDLGYVDALRQMAYTLRQGDLVPGGYQIRDVESPGR
jgi:hypothetical protein